MDAHSLECLDFLRVRELLAGFAQSSLGRGLAGGIKPVTRRELIQRWLNQVTELQAFAEDHGIPPFAGITDVRDIVRRCTPPLRVSVDEMAQLGAALRGTHAVAGYLAKLPESSPELKHLAERIGDFGVIAERIAGVIDEHGAVRDNASPRLSRIRSDVATATAAIRETVEKMLHDPAVRRWLQYPNHTFHNDRMVLPVRTEYRGRIQGIVHRHSDSGATIYVEPGIAVELNNQISNLKIEEEEEINRLLWELSHEVHLNSEAILKTMDTLAVLDLVVAKLRMAKAFRLTCPNLTDASTLEVREARHPLLLDLQRRRREAGEPTEEIVAINYRLGHDFDLMVITGPNTGGKTVTLKTIGLLTLMIQAGMPVPVGPGSTFGLFGSVYIDIGDEQSMQQSLSTFSGHLKRLLDILRRSNAHTLALIDELGAGTDPDEGAALGRAVLDELQRLGAKCLVTTHLGALKGYALQRARVENASVEFDAETLRPTYHLRIGEPGSSNAIDIAQRLGLPGRLVAAARQNISRNSRALRAALESTSRVKREAENARAAADQARLAADKAASEASSERDKLERQRTDFQTWVQRVVHLQPGDAVRVRNFDRDGKIVRMKLDIHRAEVDVGAFSVEVPLGDVLPPETPAPPPRPMPPARLPESATHPRGPRKPRGDGRPAGPPQQTGQPPRPAESRPPRDARPRPNEGERPRRPEPELDALSEDQAANLEPGDRVYARMFHREGTINRVNAAKKVASVNVGLLEIEVPFSGLARVRPPRTRPPRPAHKPGGPQAPVPPAPPQAESTTPHTGPAETPAIPDDPSSDTTSPPASDAAPGQ